MKHSLELSIPFDDSKTAGIVFDVLSVDKEPQRHITKKEVELVDSSLQIRLTSDQVKTLRVMTNASLDAVKLCLETVKLFR